MLQAFLNPHAVEAGCDEAGRGCLAGPVFAAAVILPVEFDPPCLDDSKKLSAAQRDELRALIERYALAWAVASVPPDEIDGINILNASLLAMHRALDQLPLRPTSLLIDGNRFKPYRNIPFHCIVRGDGLYRPIAAASILAKTHRDEYMARLSAQYPQYHWASNKGYPSAVHRQAIRQYGSSPHHRRSFRLLPQGRQGELFDSSG